MADRSSILAITVLAFGALFSLLYLSSALHNSGGSRVTHDPAVIPTQPKISQLQAVESAENHLISKVPGVQDIRLDLVLYNFSLQEYSTNPAYIEYRMSRLEWRAWPLAQVKEHPELLNLGLLFVHANETQYIINSTSHTFTMVCEKPSISYPMPIAAAKAARDRLVYRVELVWPRPSIPINDSLYLIDAETGKVVWSSVDFVLDRLPMPNVSLYDNKTISQLYNERANPPSTMYVDIERVSSDPSSGKSYFPKEVRVTLGIDNRVVWTNRDTVPHSVVSDSGYVDKLTGKKFDSGMILPGSTFEFTFTGPGEYWYHGAPLRGCRAR